MTYRNGDILINHVIGIGFQTTLDNCTSLLSWCTTTVPALAWYCKMTEAGRKGASLYSKSFAGRMRCVESGHGILPLYERTATNQESSTLRR